MMSEVVRIQIDRDIKSAEQYVKQWFVWTDEQKFVAEIIKKYSKKLNGYLTMPLASDMLTMEYEQKLLADI